MNTSAENNKTLVAAEEPEKLDLRSFSIPDEKSAQLLALFPDAHGRRENRLRSPKASLGRERGCWQRTLRDELAGQGRLFPYYPDAQRWHVAPRAEGKCQLRSNRQPHHRGRQSR